MKTCRYYIVEKETVRGTIGGPEFKEIIKDIYCAHKDSKCRKGVMCEPKCKNDIDKCELPGGFNG
jgi:hypothetical protein